MILHGDCLELLRQMPANSVHMVVTSPPYWGLRDYGVPPTVWGGNPLCTHAWESAGTREGYTGKKKWQHSMTNEPDSNGRGEPRVAKKRSRLRTDTPDGWTQIEQGEFCAGCGAWRGCLGLEPTIELYIAHLVLVFEEVRRVLRKDGTCWLNIGDSYATGTSAPRVSTSTSGAAVPSSWGGRSQPQRAGTPRGYKTKDLLMMPARVALALQAAGWYLRADIVWAKTNPMPESTRDRPTKSHEYVYLLAKSARYFYDGDAIRECVTGNAHHRGGGTHPKARVINKNLDSRHRPRQNASFSAAVTDLVSSRNRRSVWTLPTAPFKGAHFATFPPRLVEPCILAGTSERGCCAVCFAPVKRIVELGAPLTAQQARAGAGKDGGYRGKATKAYGAAGAQDPSAVKARILARMRERVTVGWKPTCAHSLVLGTERSVVLDPFGGSGTTAMVCERLGRDYILIELGAHNVKMAEGRVAPARVEVPA